MWITPLSTRDGAGLQMGFSSHWGAWLVLQLSSWESSPLLKGACITIHRTGAYICNLMAGCLYPPEPASILCLVKPQVRDADAVFDIAAQQLQPGLGPAEEPALGAGWLIQELRDSLLFPHFRSPACSHHLPFLFPYTCATERLNADGFPLGCVPWVGLSLLSELGEERAGSWAGFEQAMRVVPAPCPILTVSFVPACSSQRQNHIQCLFSHSEDVCACFSCCVTCCSH